MSPTNNDTGHTADDIFGPPVLVWRADPLFNQGHIAAELALAILRKLEERLDLTPDDEADVSHSIERLETFLSTAHDKAAARAIETRSAETAGLSPKGESASA